MVVEVVTRIAKELFRAGAGLNQKQLYMALHPVVRKTYNAGFQLDRYIGTPTAMRTIKIGEPSVTRLFTPGKGEVFTPEINSEKTPIDQELTDAVLAGFESTAQLDKISELISEIINSETGFAAANAMQRNKAAIDLLRLGIFQTYDKDGTAHQLDFNRDGTLATTYDFTAGGATIDEALTEMITLLSGFGCPKGNLGIIMGKSWLDNFESDTAVLSKLTAYNGSFINLIPPQFQGVDGLNVIGTYRPAGSLSSITIMGYQPQWDYRVNAAAAAPYLPDVEAVMFNLSAFAPQINTGIPIKNEKGKIEIVNGDLVIASDVSADPACEYIIGKSRYAFMRFVNHTCKSVGTF